MTTELPLWLVWIGRWCSHVSQNFKWLRNGVEDVDHVCVGAAGFVLMPVQVDMGVRELGEGAFLVREMVKGSLRVVLDAP